MKKILMSLMVFIMLLTTISFAETKAKVNVDAIRMRASASTDSKIITNVYLEDIVEILEENGEWSKIKYGENVGYTKTQFLTKIKNNENTIKETDTTSNNTVSDYTNVSQNSENTTETPKTEEPSTQTPENTVAEDNYTDTQNVVTEPLDIQQDVNVGKSIVLKNALKLRRIPNFSNSENAEIAENVNVQVVNVLGNWCKISDGTNIGWIVKNKLYSTKSEETTVVPEENSAKKTETVDNTNTENTESPKSMENAVAENTTVENAISNDTETNSIEENKVSENATTQNNQETRKGIITVETARVRQSASTKAEVIGTLDENEVVNILGEEGEFYKISTKSVSSGYVSKKLIREKDVTSRSLTTERTDDTISEEANEQLTQMFSQEHEVEENEDIAEIVEVQTEVINNSRKNELVEFAKQYLGYSYVSGGHSPQTGFDCSGFTRYIFGHFGYSLGATAASQTALGIEIAREDLQIADLILYYDEGMTKIGHVGIYIGDGNFIHSANPKRGVVIDNLNTNSYYSKRFVTARRIVE